MHASHRRTSQQGDLPQGSAGHTLVVPIELDELHRDDATRGLVNPTVHLAKGALAQHLLAVVVTQGHGLDGWT